MVLKLIERYQECLLTDRGRGVGRLKRDFLNLRAVLRYKGFGYRILPAVLRDVMMLLTILLA